MRPKTEKQQSESASIVVGVVAGWIGNNMRRNTQRRLLIDALFLGVVGACSAQVFVFMVRVAQDWLLTGLAGYQPMGLPGDGGVAEQVIGPHGLWLIPLVTTLGGLLSGVLVFSIAPEAEGHGTDSAVRAFHRAGGYIRPRVIPLKAVTSAITIGSGGAAGREGPTALIAAGVGSMYATLLRRPEEERRLHVLMGMAAALAAVFRSPIGTAFFAVEVLYSRIEFESNALLYTMLGSVVAYALNGLFVGWEPIFQLPEPHFAAFIDYGWYLVLGGASGLIATLLPLVFYGVRDAFLKLPGPPHIKPAIGGLGTGLMALALPQVLGGGYGWIQQAMEGHLGAGLLLTLVFAKMIAFALTVGSGGSGGVFAPGLFIGAMLGGFIAVFARQPPAPFVIVGMAAVFGGAARVPLTTLLMVTEMTGGYHLLAPAALSVMVSTLVQMSLSEHLPYQSLYEQQVPTPIDSPVHQVTQLKDVLRLHGGQLLTIPDTLSHTDLLALSTSGVAIELPDGKQLSLGTLRSPNASSESTLSVVELEQGSTEAQILAIFRQNHILVPRADMMVEAGDQLLLLAPPEAWGRLEHFLDRFTGQARGHDR